MMDRFEEHSRCDQGLSAKCRMHNIIKLQNKKGEEMNERSAENEAINQGNELKY